MKGITMFAIAGLALVGLLISIYMSLYKLGLIPAIACGDGGCTRVQDSPWSAVLPGTVTVSCSPLRISNAAAAVIVTPSPTSLMSLRSTHVPDAGISTATPAAVRAGFLTRTAIASPD